jgi:N-acyl homoserine lactone hydrolase
VAQRVYAFHCGGVRSFRGFYDVLDEHPVEVVYEPTFFFMVDLDGRRVLFDTGMNRRLVREDDGSLGVLMSDEDTLVPKLAQVSVSLADLEGVVVSHLHNDHAGGLDCIGKETPIYVGAQELEFARHPPEYQRSLFDAEDLQTDRNWVPVSGELDILGDGRLVLIPTPGHTPGHQVLKVRLPTRTIVLCGDAAYLSEKMRMRRVPGVVWNPDLLVRSWELLEGLERSEGALLVFTHDLDFREKKPLAPSEWYA